MSGRSCSSRWIRSPRRKRPSPPTARQRRGRRRRGRARRPARARRSGGAAPSAAARVRAQAGQGGRGRRGPPPRRQRPGDRRRSGGTCGRPPSATSRTSPATAGWSKAAADVVPPGAVLEARLAVGALDAADDQPVPRAGQGHVEQPQALVVGGVGAQLRGPRRRPRSRRPCARTTGSRRPRSSASAAGPRPARGWWCPAGRRSAPPAPWPRGRSSPAPRRGRSSMLALHLDVAARPSRRRSSPGRARRGPRPPGPGPGTRRARPRPRGPAGSGCARAASGRPRRCGSARRP